MKKVHGLQVVLTFI